MPPSAVLPAEQRQDTIRGHAQVPQHRQRKPRGVPDFGNPGRRLGHPFRDVGQRPVRLLDDQHRGAAQAVTPDNPDALAAARMERVMDRYSLALIPGSMSPSCRVAVKRIWLSL
jgi:hypothetical protein